MIQLNEQKDLNSIGKDELIQLIIQLDNRLQEQNSQVQLLVEQVEYLNHKLYGTKSEKGSKIAEGQLSLFNEAELIAEEEKEEEIDEVQVESYKRKKKNKTTFTEKFKNLKQVDIVIPLPEEEQLCPICNSQMTKIGKKLIRKEVVVIPATAEVRNYYVDVYKCEECESETDEAEIVSATVPNPVIPHSYASPEAISYVIKEKYVNATPLYRLETEWKHMGVDINRATMAKWIITVAQLYFASLIEYMHRQLLELHYLHADETTVQVLKEQGKRAESKSYMWVYATIKESDKQIRIFDYRPNRSSQNPCDYLMGYKGYLITDAYEAYEKVPGTDNVFCWAHARRKFVDAIPKKMKNVDDTLAKKGLNKIQRLFAIEKKIEALTPEEKVKIRHEKSKPILDDFFSMCEKNIDYVSYGSLIYKALFYSINNKEELCKFLDDGLLPLTNSLAERAIRPFTLGRKNWLFATSVNGAVASAATYSLVETAKANNVDPYKYILCILSKMPNDSTSGDELYEKYMPWSTFVKDYCRGNV